MENQISASEFKLRSIVQHAYMGILEIDAAGEIININNSGQALFAPLFQFLNIAPENFYSVANFISPAIAVAINAYSGQSGVIMANEVFHFTYQNNNAVVERDYKFTISKMFEDCIVMSVEDETAKIVEGKAMQQAQVDKAMAQGKFELAAEVLHDIGNAVVGFGSYLTRINRLLEQNTNANLQNVAVFLKSQEVAFAQAIGAPKAGALVNMVEGICKNQKDSQLEIKKAITEQLNIINHIQEILNIQRQYVVGHETQDRKPVNLGTVIYDCRAMVYASIEKKSIKLRIDIPSEPIIIKGDRTKLMQVILNILKNSIEAIAMEAAEKIIEVSLVKIDKEVRLTISDNGKGFDKETGARLLERGFTTKSTGTGLGLYNCRSIIESHSGIITITSAGTGLGATITVIFNN